MAGVAGAAVLIAAFTAVTGSCGFLAVRLYRAGSSRGPRRPGDS